MSKDIQDFLSDYVRTKFRADSIYRRIMSPLPIEDVELDLQVPSNEDEQVMYYLSKIGKEDKFRTIYLDM